MTNFDITRYDVDKIMASNTLLAGEFARKNKETEAASSNEAIETAAVQPENTNSGNGPDWKMVLYQTHEQPIESSSIDRNNNAPISAALQDLIGIDSNHQQMVDESSANTTTNKLNGGHHFLNPSSLVTSLSSSREGSPDKAGSMLFGRPPLASKLVTPTTATGSWFPSQIRPTTITMSHLPLFAAWNDT